MSKTGFTTMFKRLMRRGDAGQSLVILALGFMGLVGFVGIVTDVSLMFVRFSQLTRAVDAASVAAAGQVRRLVPTDLETNNHCNLAVTDPTDPTFFDTTIGTCVQAQNYAFARSYANVSVAARQFIEFYGLNPSAVVVDMCATVSQTNPSTQQREAISGMEEDFAELCTIDNKKLIRVRAQVESPTVFLALLGWPNFLLQADSISETATLDVVLMLDVSESMLNETTMQTWANAGYTNIYVPPSASPYDGSAVNMAAAIAADPGSYPGAEVAAADPVQLWQALTADNPSVDGFAWQEIAALFRLNDTNSAFNVRSYTYPGYSASDHTRSECRVQFFPASVRFGVESDVQTVYDSVGAGWTSSTWGGFVPTYNYYGCCNDPNGDGQMYDLLCEPFKSARDATEQFIQRIDFLRGDRVAFVTFDRSAFLVNVDNGSTITHMIDNESLALQTLRESIGVRTEPNFYEPTEDSGFDTVPWDNAGRPSALTGHDYPVSGSCPFQDAVLEFPFTSAASASPGDDTYPSALENIMYPRGSDWDTYLGGERGAGYSYDLWASCRGTNIGAALREGSAALLNPSTTRVDGVWVMVLLSDGAAGGSDPVSDAAAGGDTQPLNIDYPYTTRTPVLYGGHGVCPAGSPGNSELVDVAEQAAGQYSFPYCSDEVPETRNFCFDPSWQDPSTLDLSNAGFANCRNVYDVDDYARDWADWVGGVNAPSGTTLTQLPTIFTIGFGLTFDGGTTRCVSGGIDFDDTQDCLGEELLRYIADVGDNFRVDTDYQQDLLDDLSPNLSVAEWGPRGECEEDMDPASASNHSDLIVPVETGVSCGNYYNAPGSEELARVFDDIASQMFTRLAG